MDEQAEWWHLPPSQVVSNSSASLSLLLPASQLSSTQEAAEVESDVERDREGEGVEDAAYFLLLLLLPHSSGSNNWEGVAAIYFLHATVAIAVLDPNLTDRSSDPPTNPPNKDFTT
ncbi:hypothetical protein TSMEX_009808 [Taenia solium]|eukprot:TsM_000101200 transcript=TsM_000101200 gene=TsM_000101200